MQNENTDALLQVNDFYVLVIDDNLDLLNIISLIFKNNGIKFDLAANGNTGLQMLLDQPQKYAALLLDIQMPDMNGFSILNFIRKNNPPLSSLPVIAMSGNTQSNDCGSFDYFLRKPFSFDVLVSAIREIIAERIYEKG